MVDEREKQEFNMAVAELNRLNVLFANVENSMMILDVHGWYHSLQTISAILSCYMKEEELKKFDTELDALLNSVTKTCSIQGRTGRSNIPRETYNKLKELYQRLRKVAKDTGLLQRAIEDAGRALR